jgi:hypothetical protein
MHARRSVPPIAWTILCILLLASFAATPPQYKFAVNIFFVSLRLGSALVLTVLGMRAYWNHWHHRASDDAGSRLLRRWRKWMFGESNSSDAFNGL